MLEIVGHTRSFTPLDLIMLIIRAPGREHGIVVAQSVVLPTSKDRLVFSVEFNEEDCLGDIFVSLQTSSRVVLAIEGVDVKFVADEDSFGSERLKTGELRDDTTDVIVCVHNAPEVVSKCLSSLMIACSGRATRIIVIDDGSRPEVVRLLENFQSLSTVPFVLVRDELASGYTKAINRGVLLSRGRRVVLLNSDTIVWDDFIDRVNSHLETDGVAMVGFLSNRATLQSVPAMIEDDRWAANLTFTEAIFDRLSLENSRQSKIELIEVQLLNGFCLALSYSTFERVGLFDERFFPSGYGEETDFQVRARHLGLKIYLDIGRIVYHFGSQSYQAFGGSLYSAKAYKTVCARHGVEVIQSFFECSREMIDGSIDRKYWRDLIEKCHEDLSP